MDSHSLKSVGATDTHSTEDNHKVSEEGAVTDITRHANAAHQSPVNSRRHLTPLLGKETYSFRKPWIKVSTQLCPI